MQVTVSYNGSTASRNFSEYLYTRKNTWGQIVSGIDFAEMRNNIAAELEEKLNFQVRYGFLQDLAQAEIDKACAILEANEHAEKVKNRQTDELIWLDSLGKHHPDSLITETAELLTSGFVNKVLDSSKFPYKEFIYAIGEEPNDNCVFDISKSEKKVYIYTFEKKDDWDLGYIKNQLIKIFDEFGRKC